MYASLCAEIRRNFVNMQKKKIFYCGAVSEEICFWSRLDLASDIQVSVNIILTA